MDAWTGLLAEQPMPGKMVGPSLFTLLKHQFEKLRAGDRFWYQNAMTPEEIQEISQVRLRDIILRNTDITEGELPQNIWQR